MMAAALVLVLAAGDAVGTVTLPLPPGLALVSSTGAEPLPAPPFPAAVVAQKLTARVGPEALEVTAAFTVTVLDAGRWSRLALLQATPGLALLEASRVEGALVAAREGQVVFVSRSAGTVSVELKVAVPWTGAAVRTARLCRGADGLEGPLQVDSDAEVAVAQPGCWVVTARRQPPPPRVVRPPLVPQVRRVAARLVSTMEGKARLTVHYALELDREQPLSFRVPAGWRLTGLLVDGVAQVAPVGEAVTVQVRPTPGAGPQGAVTLTLERDFGVFHLSGRLPLELPGVGWPTQVVELVAHLPAVFGYARAGGSLEPVALPADAPGDVEQAPGRRLAFRQFLVGEVGPTLELGYAVDLDGRYFSLEPAAASGP